MLRAYSSPKHAWVGWLSCEFWMLASGLWSRSRHHPECGAGQTPCVACSFRIRLGRAVMGSNLRERSVLDCESGKTTAELLLDWPEYQPKLRSTATTWAGSPCHDRRGAPIKTWRGRGRAETNGDRRRERYWTRLASE